jgi:serine phosphatase RsbU (regulator of sigma subunit)
MDKQSSTPLTDRENLLVESFRVLSSDLDIDTVTKNSLGILIKRFDAEAACLFLTDLRDYQMRACCISSEVPDKVHILPLDDENNIIGWKVDSTEPIMIDKIDESSEYFNTIKKAINITPKNMLGIPLFAGGEFLGVIQVINGRNGKGFINDDLDIIEVVGERIALTLRNAWILEEAVRASEESKSLYEVGIALSGSFELEDLLDKILENLRRVIEFNMAIIYLVDPNDGTINKIATKGVENPDDKKIHLKIGQGVCGRVAESGQGIIISDVDKNDDYIAFRPQTKSEMAVPLIADHTVIGVFNVENDNADAYTDRDLQLMTGFASMAAVSIERAKLLKERMAAKRIEHELSIARRIQKTFLPADNPVINGFDIAGVNIPSQEVGGDYYDFIHIVEDQWGIAIGDVAGNGIPASLIMAAYRAGLKAEIRNNFAIRAILKKVNNLLYESIERDRYVTAVYGVLDSKNKLLTFSNAGHNPPILRRANGNLEYLKDGGLALGIFPQSEYKESSVFLNSGDILLFYTDGVTEVDNKKNEEFGEERLIDVLHKVEKLSSSEIVKEIIKEVRKFGSMASLPDDLTLVSIKAL